MPDELAQRVIGCIAETQHLDLKQIGIDSSFEELGIDSLDGINILFALENEFEISISDEQAREIRTVRAMADGVRQLVNGGASPDAAPGR